MDLFQADGRIELLQKYKTTERLFSPLVISTCSVCGWLSRVKHDESDLIDIPCEGNIVKIDSNFYHATKSGYVENVKSRTSKRGRKTKPKEKKIRQCQGDGQGFNSQITFTILGSHIRNCSPVPDKHSNNAIILNDGREKITKVYKIKVFRNGNITIPGILTENMEDVKQPIEDLCEYLSDLFIEDVHVVTLFSVMRNYKFRLLEGQIDINKLQEHCEGEFVGLTLTNFKDITQFILNPLFMDNNLGNDVFCIDLRWNRVIANNQIKPDMIINWVGFGQFLKESDSHNRTLLIEFSELQNMLQGIDLIQIYNDVQTIMNSIYSKYFIEFTSFTVRNIIKMLIRKFMIKLEKSLEKSENNMMSHTTYDPERYPAFLIKIKTPMMTKPKKRTTVKIFPSGKINIDGANNRYQAKYIYYWLNHLLYTNKKSLIYSDEDSYGTDSEFSSGEEYSI